MNLTRGFVLTTLAFLSGFNLARGADKVLVPGNPPLTKSLVDLDTAATEHLLDLRLTGEQRQKFQQLFVEDWKKTDQSERVKWAKTIKPWAELLAADRYERNLSRALNQPKFFEFWHQGTRETCRWRAALHEESYKPGSVRNPVLVEGDPPLTQLIVDRYTDYVERMIDLSISRGFTVPQRQVFQDYLVKGWNKMDAASKEEMLADMKLWQDAAGASTAAANKSINALRPKLLAQLQTAGDDQRSQWLLELVTLERKKFATRRADQNMQFDAMRSIIRHTENGYWRTNSANGRVEWVPGR